MIAQASQRTRSIQRLLGPFSQPAHNELGVAATGRSPGAKSLKTPLMNKTDTCLHKKSSVRAAASFRAATPVQNGGKIKICTMASTLTGFAEEQSVRTCTMNAVHGAPGCQFRPPHLYACQNRSPQSYIFQSFHHLERGCHPFKDLAPPNPPSAPAHGYTWRVLTPRDGSEHGKKERSSKEGCGLGTQA